MSKPTYLQGSVQIQERDKNILEFIHRFRVVTRLQIERMFFKNANSNAGYQRLRKLESEDFLKIYNLRSLNQAIYQITNKGVQVIGRHDEQLKKKGDSNRMYHSQIEHDLGLTDIAISILNLPHDISYQSENEIRGNSDYRYDHFIPDALLTLKEGLPLTLAIEYERTFKKPKLYEEKFYYMDKFREKYHRYLYVLEDLRKKSFFERVVSKSPNLSERNFMKRLLFVRLEDLISAPYECPIYTHLGSPFSMRRLFEEIRKMKMKILSDIPLIIKETNRWSRFSSIENDFVF